ncbi:MULTISPECIES: apolipoprotein N-acyltransferase [unclassified Nitratiruptor]|uniref:apolipoprotein N-acyltransferase n=1 Tax=unclassified Nitratiruptor TaxID=2624044 RepID=UPI0019161999|nr:MULTISPECIES: apolipoprotein N-acyltransferase [unclassified Nitratiruptor]
MLAPCPCINYPLFKKFGRYFSITLLIKSFFIALIASSFLLFEVLSWHNPYLQAVLALGGFYLVIINKRLFWIGFFIGVIWFWWIALSFRYYDLTWMIPLVIIAIGLVYGIIFKIAEAIGSLLQRAFSWQIYPYTNALFLFLVSYIHPFNFNWYIPELALLHTPFGVDKLSFGLILIVLLLLSLCSFLAALIAALLLTAALHHYTPQPIAPLKISLVTTHVPQDKKWKAAYRKKIIETNLQAINNAIAKKYDVVVLPESAFPLFLDYNTPLLLKLLQLSHKIAIVTGALHAEGQKIFNSTFVFHKGRFIILDKVILVPFGEEIPLPKPLAKWVNNLFFDGASDYSAAKTPQTYTIKGVTFTNAICYEATHPLIYHTSTPYIIAISNNAWFIPSYEPLLQNLIIKYYATIYKKVVYHATNIAKTEIIR